MDCGCDLLECKGMGADKTTFEAYLLPRMHLQRFIAQENDE